MFGLFKKKSEKETLLKKYKTLIEQAFKLSPLEQLAVPKQKKLCLLEKIKALETQKKVINTYCINSI